MGNIWAREDVCAGFWWEKTSLGRLRHKWKGNIKISKRNLFGGGEGGLDQSGSKWEQVVVCHVWRNRIRETCILAEELCISRRTQRHGVTCLVDWLGGWLSSQSVSLLLFEYLGHFVNCPYKKM